jgi:hypothetical protein
MKMPKFVIAVLTIAALAAIPASTFIIDSLIEITPQQYLPKLMGSRLALGRTCPDEMTIIKANADWLAYLGIVADWTWKNASQIWPYIRNELRTDDVNVLQKICRSRDLFYITLGQANYYNCINIYALMHYTSDWSAAAYYVRIWSHLDFMCNIGYQQFINRSAWSCLSQITQNTGCNAAYLANVDWNNWCPAVANYTSCTKEAADGFCGKPTGYFACEDVRLGYDYGAECNIRCMVN